MPQWDAEIEVDQALARTLIRGRYPALETRSLELLGAGWDNTVWATEDGVAFRFPRREMAVAGITREIALLPQIAPRLPQPIPNAAYPGAPSSLFPWPWFGSHLIEGREIAQGGFADHTRMHLAHDLGVFLRCLHELSLPELGQLPFDPFGRADMPARVPATRIALEELDRSGATSARAGEILAEAEMLPISEECVLVHGDLHVRHALIGAGGRLSGVIDWGDICRAPAAVDLSLYWSLFSPAGRQVFRDAYGPLSDATLLTARVLALFLNAVLAAYARDVRIPGLEAEARSGVQRALTD